jgi:glyoxylase-like metal-dependent hydrolase (beta-lactamase superfamily II)
MILKQFISGPFEANNYLIIDENSKKAVLIDASGSFDKIKAELDAHNATLEKILLTHAHIDHIAGCYEIQQKLGAKVFINKEDMFLVQNLKQQLQMFGLPPAQEPRIDDFFKDGDTIEVGNLQIKVIHTKGHSKGGSCFLIEDKLFSGDTLFLGSVGRTDLPGGDYKELEKSITQKIFTLKGDLTIYPGHGPATTLEREKAENPFFGQRPIV